MTRLWNWAENLTAFLALRRDAPAQWGTNDCALFAADAVHAMTGVDMAAQFRGRYRTAAGAAALIDELGGLQAIAAAAFGSMPRSSWRLARRGDVVLADLDGRDTLMVCDGAYMVGPGERGAVYRPMADGARLVWEV